MNVSLLQPATTLTWHVLIDALDHGQVAAWVAEFPECRIVADSQEVAIAELETLLHQRMTTIKVMPLQLSSKNSKNPWVKLSGALKDNESFVEWSDRFWAEKQQNTDEEILSVEECLEIL
jgi:hypothetical protein